MSRFVPLLLLFFVLTLCVGVLLSVMDIRGTQAERRNAQRQKDVEVIANRVEAFARRNKTLPNFSSTLQQLGTEQTGCKLSTNTCDIQNDSCFDLHFLTESKDLSLPSDILIGTYYKTGYGVQFDHTKQYLTVTACGAENGQTIQAERSFIEILQPTISNAKK